jgi:hypothetical protein
MLLQGFEDEVYGIPTMVDVCAQLSQLADEDV